MTIDDIKHELRTMGMTPRVLNGHRVVRILADTWLIGGEWRTLDEAAKQIADAPGTDAASPFADLFLAMAEHELRRRDGAR